VIIVSVRFARSRKISERIGDNNRRSLACPVPRCRRERYEKGKKRSQMRSEELETSMRGIGE